MIELRHIVLIVGPRDLETSRKPVARDDGQLSKVEYQGGILARRTRHLHSWHEVAAIANALYMATHACGGGVSHCPAVAWPARA
jgi:hypothetical protein